MRLLWLLTLDSSNLVAHLTAGVELARPIAELGVCLTLVFAVCLPRSHQTELAGPYRTTTAGYVLAVASVIAVCPNLLTH